MQIGKPAFRAHFPHRNPNAQGGQTATDVGGFLTTSQT